MVRARWAAITLMTVAAAAAALLAQAPTKTALTKTAPAKATSLATGRAPIAVVAPDRLARIDAMLQSYVDRELIGGAVALVLRDGKPAYQKTVGWADKEARRPMRADTVFRIASQTKALTSVAVLTL